MPMNEQYHSVGLTEKPGQIHSVQEMPASAPSTAPSAFLGGLWRFFMRKERGLCLKQPKPVDLERRLVGCIFSQTADKTVANTTTETTLKSSTAEGTSILPANSLAVGNVIRVRAAGLFSTDAIAPTLRIRVKIGTTVVLDTTAATLGAGLASRHWGIDADFTILTLGAAGTVRGIGAWEHQYNATGELRGNGSSSTPALDTTVSRTVDITAEWGTADADNTITCARMTIEILN